MSTINNNKHKPSKLQNISFKNDQLQEFLNKHLITPFIIELSNQIQKNSKGGIILNIENDALEHIEYLILSILNQIIHPNSTHSNSSSTASPTNINKSFNNFNSTIDLREIECRIRRILPKNLGDAACQKVQNVLAHYDSLSSSSRLFNLVTKMTKKTQLLNTNGILVYPVDLFNSILTRDICKTEHVNIYIVSVLEFITKDILRFCSAYARNLGKFIINKKDVRTAIYADHMLTELFLNNSTTQQIDLPESPIDSLNEFNYDFDTLSIDSGTIYYPSNISNISGTSSNSDTTICNDCNSLNNEVKLKFYAVKIKELLYEQSQHLQDLNLIRKVFDYYFKKALNVCQLNQELKDEGDKLVNEIFDGINDIYDCALKLFDSLDECLNQNSNDQQVVVGSVFWELAEGAEFDVYNEYICQTDRNQNELIIKFLQLSPVINSYLNDNLKNLVDISKYLLPRLLLAPNYHILYIYDTVEYLSGISQNDEDYDLLKQTLDTLMPIKFKLNENSKKLRRPIETSIRIIQQNINPIDFLGQKYLHLVRQTDFYYYNQLTELKLRELEASTQSSDSSSDSQTSAYALNSFILKKTHLYLHNTVLKVIKTNNHQIESLNKVKQSERVMYLFDGIIYLFKSIGGGKLKLKSEIHLAKCYLVDRKFDHHDDYFIELQFFGSETEYYVFKLKNQTEKAYLMSLLCYVNYRFQLDRFLQTIIEDINRSNPLPIPPDGYRFDSEDSPEVILFDSDDLSNRLSADGPTIKAATLEKLVERLTHHLYLYPKFSRTFLMCYREFCTPDELFSLLIERFNVPDLQVDFDRDTINKIDLETKIRYKREYQQPIKLKVINVLKHWIDGYFYDFETNSALYASLNDFVFSQLNQSNKRYHQILEKIIQKKVNQIETEIDHGFESVPSFEIHLEKQYPFELLTIHPLEFARQATLMESEIYKAIQPNELISLGWTKGDKKHELSPNVSKLINLSNKFTYWYAKCIVDTLNFDERVAVMQRILDIAQYFYEFNNFSGLKEIYAALETVSVRRLQATREKIGLETHNMFKKFQELFDTHQTGYLDRLKKCNPPCVPFIGIHLTSILKTREFNKLNSDEHNKALQKAQIEAGLIISAESLNNTTTTKQLINISKYRKLIDLVTELLQYQNTTYKFRVYNEVRTYLRQEIETFEATSFGDDSDSFASSPFDTLSDHEEFFFATQNQAHIIENWLFKKSKQIEPENVQKYPHLRKYSLKSPIPKNLKNDNIQQSQSIIASASNVSLISQRQYQNQKSTIKSSVSTLSTYVRDTSQPNVTHHIQHHHDKVSLSSADSSAPNSPPPNYDDVIAPSTVSSISSVNKNCFDNPSYFVKIEQTYPHIKRHSFSLPLHSPNKPLSANLPNQSNTIFFPDRPASASNIISSLNSFGLPTQPPPLPPRPSSPHFLPLQPPPVPRRNN